MGKPSNAPSQPYDPSYTGLVDYSASTGNLLFRGNLPLLDPSGPPYYYAYDEMNTRMQALTSSILPDFDLTNYTLLDICLLDNQGDLEDLQLVIGNFPGATLPTTQWPPYQYVTPWMPWVTLGSGTVTVSSTGSYPGNVMWWPFEPGDAEQEGSAGFNFSGLVAFANTVVNATPALEAQSVVTYVHCDSGVNRTGAFTVSYLLQYGSSQYSNITTLKDAYTTADQMVWQDQAPNSDYFPMITAFCNQVTPKANCSYTPG